MKRLICLAAIYCLCSSAFAFNDRPILVGQGNNGRAPLFLELWNNAAFYSTNLEKQNFSALLGRFEGKVGLNFFDFPLQAYGVYYGASSQSLDYWDNSLYSGVGARIFPFRDYSGDRWYNEWLKGIRIYGEGLNASYLKNSVSAEGLAKTDSRYGLEIWYAWNQYKPDETIPWGELWLKADYRQTNFGWEKFEDYVVYCQPKFGRHLAEGIEAYLRADITYSGKSGPAYSFLNIADYGVGIRFVPLRGMSRDNDIFRTFKMYAEILGVTYLKDEPAAAKRVNSDLRFGVEVAYGR